MANVVAVLVVVLLVGLVLWSVVRNRRTVVARRGTSVGADLGALSDQPRVRVSELWVTGSDRVRVVLIADPAAAAAAGSGSPADLDLTVALNEDEFAFEVLQEWRRSGTSVAMVIPPGSQLVRLRSVDDLQPITLRRIDRS